MFQVKTGQFEGPLALLLDLIEKNKLDITTLSLAKVTDDYLEYLERADKIGLTSLSEFLFIASQLILIKSKALLPLFELAQEDEEEIENLQQRLLEYQQFKKIAKWLGQQWGKGTQSFSRPEGSLEARGFVSPNIKKKELEILFTEVIAEIPSEEALKEEVLEKAISLEEKIIQLRRFLEKKSEISFQQAIQAAQNKIEAVVAFLAVLELAKRRVLFVKQAHSFGEIILKAKKH
jgi:segregation and condensation protein A